MGREKVEESNKINERFVPMPYSVLFSEAYTTMSKSSKVAFQYFLADKKVGHQTIFKLTFFQAKKAGVCNSSATFDKIKKQLVAHGFFDPWEPGGLNAPSKFKKSYRWKKYGTANFKEVAFVGGMGPDKLRKVAMIE